MDVERVVRTHISSNDSVDEVPQDLLEAVRNGQVGLLEIVRALGDYLTSTEDEVRVKGITLLSNVLDKAPAARINRQGTQVLTSFYCDKLEDHECVPSTLKGLVVLTKLPTFGAGEASQVFRSLAGNFKSKSHVQSTRHIVFLLVDALLAKHLSAMKTLGDEFVSGYIKLAEGEKDPRNLILAFGIGRVILIEFDPYKHLDDMFDIIFCYFPITFRPPPNDPYNITPIDLQEALRGAMSATPRFAPMAMPLFLEKLPASLGESKKDVLRGLTACLPVFGGRAVQGYASDLWDALRTEIFYSPDAEIEKEALLTLKTLIATLYPDTPETKAADLALEIIKECQSELKEPEKSKAKPATKVLMTCVHASPLIGSYALSQVLPQLFRMYHEDSEIPKRGPILSAIADLVKSVREVYTAEGTTRSHETERTIEKYRDELLSLMSSGIDSRAQDCRLPGLQGAEHLVNIPGFLGAEEVTYLVSKIDGVLTSREPEALQNEALKTLSAISALTTRPIEEHTLPLLFDQLPGEAPALSDEKSRYYIRQVLESLATLCVQPGLFEALHLRLVRQFSGLCEGSTSTDQENMDVEEDAIRRECQVAFAYSLLHAIRTTLQRKIALKHHDIAKHYEHLVPRLYSIFIDGARTDRSIANDPRLMAEGAAVAMIMTQTLASDQQASHATTLFEALTNSDLIRLAGKHGIAEAHAGIGPLKEGASVNEQNLVILITADAAGLRPESLLCDLNAVLQSLLQWAIHKATSQVQVISVCHLMASLINKRAQDLEPFLSSARRDLWSLCEATQPLVFRRALTMWIWIGRALLVRNHAAGLPMIIQVFDLFARDNEVASLASASLSILSDSHGDRILSKENFTIVKTLYKQRLFSSLLPLMIEGSKTRQGSAQTPYLLALGSTIAIIPQGLIISHLAELLPLIMRGLALPNAEIRYNMLRMLSSILEVEGTAETGTLLRSQAKSLADVLVVTATDLREESSSPRTRIAALACLSILPDTIRYDVLHTVKTKVLKELARAIDDPKRAVRREAVVCRSKWFTFGGAGT